MCWWNYSYNGSKRNIDVHNTQVRCSTDALCLLTPPTDLLSNCLRVWWLDMNGAGTETSFLSIQVPVDVRKNQNSQSINFLIGLELISIFPDLQTLKPVMTSAGKYTKRATICGQPKKWRYVLKWIRTREILWLLRY